MSGTESPPASKPGASQPAPYPDAFYAGRDRNTRPSAETVVPLVVELGPFRSVVDVGCGAGTWLAVFRERGVEDILGIEGGWLDVHHLCIPRENFLHHDLRRPLRLNRRFDLVVSLEVAEHLPPEAAPAFVESLTGLGPVVLFSAAVPYQGGQHHLNERWPDYWAALFRERGFRPVDALRRQLWALPEVRPWYAQNLLLFVDERHLGTNPSLKREAERTDARQLALVHPRLYERNSAPENLSLRVVLGVLPRLVLEAIRRRLPPWRQGRRDPR